MTDSPRRSELVQACTCTFQLALSIGNPDGAVFLLDNMGFIQP
jgi:hypothetical protein